MIGKKIQYFLNSQTDQTIANHRQLKGKEKVIVVIVAILFSIVGLWTNSYGIIQSVRQGGLFVGFLLFLIFLLYPFNEKSSKFKVPLLDWICAVLGAAGGLYTFFMVEAFAVKVVPIPSNFDILFGVITILLVLEAARRAAGKWIPIISAFFLFYAYFGRYFPGIFAHRGFFFNRILIRMYLVDEGIYGITTRVAATYIFLFILFGAFLQASGVANFFNQFALALAGGSVGGPAKVAVIASAVTGTISGSGVANVVTTGSFTIPLMKRVGYKPHFAAAVEAAASSGGLFMPPVMGSAAFVMAEFLGVSYIKIMIAGIIPAILYYIAVFSDVHFEALKLNLVGLPKKELPNLKEVVLQGGHLVLPVFVLIFILLSGRSPVFSAFFALISTILISQIKKETRMGLKSLFVTLNTGGKSILVVGIACVSCGMIVGVMAMTGIGQVIAYNILSLSNNVLFFALFYVMIASIFLSMGLPGTATYIVVATVCAPALIRMGVIPMVAHFFVFYFGCLSNLTPPVALASYAAAGISGSKPSLVAWTGFRMVFPVFIIPYVFVFSPMLLAQNIKFPAFLLLLCSTILAIYSFAIAERGFFRNKLSNSQRLLFLLVSILLIIPKNIFSDLTGFILFILLFGFLSKKGTEEK